MIRSGSSMWLLKYLRSINNFGLIWSNLPQWKSMNFSWIFRRQCLACFKTLKSTINCLWVISGIALFYKFRRIIKYKNSATREKSWTRLFCDPTPTKITDFEKKNKLKKEWKEKAWYDPQNTYIQQVVKVLKWHDKEGERSGAHIIRKSQRL